MIKENFIFQTKKVVLSILLTTSFLSYSYNAYSEELGKKYYISYNEKAEEHNNQGLKYYNAGEYDKAVTEYLDAIILDPTVDIYQSNVALAYAMLFKYPEAIKWAKFALDINPKNSTAYNTLGIAYHFGYADYNKAIENYVKASEIKPNEPLYYANIAKSYYELGHYNNANLYIEKSISLKPNYDYALGIKKNILKFLNK